MSFNFPENLKIQISCALPADDIVPFLSGFWTPMLTDVPYELVWVFPFICPFATQELKTGSSVFFLNFYMNLESHKGPNFLKKVLTGQNDP